MRTVRTVTAAGQVRALSSSLHEESIDFGLYLRVVRKPHVTAGDLVTSPEPADVFARMPTICVPRVRDSLLLEIADRPGFELVEQASRNRNNKVRDIAVDVVETGWLDQPAQPASRPVITRGPKTPPPAGGSAREFPAAPRGAAGNLAGAQGTASGFSWHVADRQPQLRGTTS